MQHPSRLLPVILSLLLLPAIPRAQDVEEANQPKLKSTEIKGLSKKLRVWYAILIKQFDFENELSGKSKSKSERKKLRKYRKDARKKKDAFEKEFEKRSKKVNLLGSMPDMIQIMDGCFPYKRMSNGGSAKRVYVHTTGAERYPYAVRWPKEYRPDTKSWPLIISLPPRKDGKWGNPKSYLEKTWPSSLSDVLSQYIVAVVEFPEKSNLSKTYGNGEEMDGEALKDKDRLLVIFGDLIAKYRIDTNRIYLEASAESVPFALRMVSLFPHRFAGLILKNPQGIQNCKSANLGLVPTLIISDKVNVATGKALAKTLSQSKVIDAKGDLPFVENGADIAEWMSDVKRPLFSQHLVYEPVLDAYRKAYWAQILNAELVADKQPRLEISADSKTNKISIKAKNISKIRLLLNDQIVDLDKEFIVEINGKVVQQLKRKRNKRLVWDPEESLILATGDQGYIFTTVADFEVPKVQDEASKTESDGDSGEGSDKDSDK